jgi:hypothetical protein
VRSRLHIAVVRLVRGQDAVGRGARHDDLLLEDGARHLGQLLPAVRLHTGDAEISQRFWALPHFAWTVPELQRHLDWVTDMLILSENEEILLCSRLPHRTSDA